jgi:hypothetical protein
MLLQWIGMTSEIPSSMTHRIKGWVLKQGLFDFGFPIHTGPPMVFLMGWATAPKPKRRQFIVFQPVRAVMKEASWSSDEA